MIGQLTPEWFGQHQRNVHQPCNPRIAEFVRNNQPWIGCILSRLPWFNIAKSSPNILLIKSNNCLSLQIFFLSISAERLAIPVPLFKAEISISLQICWTNPKYFSEALITLICKIIRYFFTNEGYFKDIISIKLTILDLLSNLKYKS